MTYAEKMSKGDYLPEVREGRGKEGAENMEDGRGKEDGEGKAREEVGKEEVAGRKAA